MYTLINKCINDYSALAFLDMVLRHRITILHMKTLHRYVCTCVGILYIRTDLAIYTLLTVNVQTFQL